MSRSRSNQTSPEPEPERHYIGDKPVIEYDIQPADRYWYARQKQAKQMGVDESELNDEPDYIECDIGYDKHNEQDNR